LCGESSQVAVSPCWDQDVPDVISADLSPDAWTRTPAVPKVHALVSSLETSAFPANGPGRHTAMTAQRLPCGRVFFGAVVIRFAPRPLFRPPGLLALQVAPTATARCPPGSQGFDVWAHFRVVAFPESRPANRPNRAIDGVGTSTPPDPRPCRLLTIWPTSNGCFSQSLTDYHGQYLTVLHSVHILSGVH
jgi:hypothetical protein